MVSNIIREAGLERFVLKKRFEIEGQDYTEKTVKRQSETAGQIYLPASWIGKRVAVILLDA